MVFFFGANRRNINYWITKERIRSHTIALSDVKDEWIDMLTAEIAEIRASQAMTKDDHLWVAEMERKKQCLLNKDRKTKGKNVKRMLSKIGARIGTPSRSASLTPKQEKQRCKLTWQNFDHICHLASFGTNDELKGFTGDVPGWRKHKKDTWLVFSDEIPFWVKIGLLKTVFANWEMKADPKTKKDRAARDASRHQASQKLEKEDEGKDGAEIPEDAEPKDNQGCTQRRGAERVGEKCRITLEARQGIMGYFSGDPRKIIGRSVGRSVNRSLGRSVGRSAGRSVDRSIGRSVGRSVGQSVLVLVIVLVLV